MGDGRQVASDSRLVFETLQQQILTFVGGSRHSVQDTFLPNLAWNDFLVHVKPSRSVRRNGNIGDHQYQ